MPADPAAPLAVPVVVVEPDRRGRRRLADRLGEQVTAVGQPGDVAAAVPAEQPAVLVLGPSCADDGALAEVERLGRERPQLAAVLVVDQLTTEVLQRALRAGVRDVLPAHADPAQLLTAVERVASSVRAPLATAPAGPAVAGRVLTVFSTKGGVGTSVVATNLAVALQRRSQRPVAIVDADLQFGDVAVLLKVAPQHTVVDAVESLDRLDAAMLQSLLVREPTSGVLVLPAPLEPAQADRVPAGALVEVVERLRELCAFVVVDTPSSFNDVVLGLLEASDEVLMVTGLDIPSIKNTKLGLQTLRLLETPTSKLRLVLNRANSKVELDVAEVERTLQVQADSRLPSDVAVPQSVNRGVPIVLGAPKSDVAKAFEALADLYVPAPSSGRRRRK